MALGISPPFCRFRDQIEFSSVVGMSTRTAPTYFATLLRKGVVNPGISILIESKTEKQTRKWLKKYEKQHFALSCRSRHRYSLENLVDMFKRVGFLESKHCNAMNIP